MTDWLDAEAIRLCVIDDVALRRTCAAGGSTDVGGCPVIERRRRAA